MFSSYFLVKSKSFLPTFYYEISLLGSGRWRKECPPGGLRTPAQGKGAGPARYKFRESGTQEIVGGAGVSEANGVPREGISFRQPSIDKKSDPTLGHSFYLLSLEKNRK